MEEMSDEDWLKWTSENVPTVKYKDCCTGKILKMFLDELILPILPDIFV